MTMATIRMVGRGGNCAAARRCAGGGRGMRMDEHILDRPIRDGEIKYDADQGWFYNHVYNFLLDDDEQALMRRWQREGRIVVDGRKVRMA